MNILYLILPFSSFSSLSPFRGSQVILYLAYFAIILVFSIHDSTEVAIQKMIEASQRMLKENSQGALGGMTPPIKRHLELEIKIPENAAEDADADKLRGLLQVKARQKEEAMYVGKTHKG